MFSKRIQHSAAHLWASISSSVQKTCYSGSAFSPGLLKGSEEKRWGEQAVNWNVWTLVHFHSILEGHVSFSCVPFLLSSPQNCSNRQLHTSHSGFLCLSFPFCALERVPISISPDTDRIQ